MSRRITLVTGAILIGAGAFALTGGASITTKERLLQLGEVELSADQRRSDSAVGGWGGWWEWMCCCWRPGIRKRSSRVTAAPVWSASSVTIAVRKRMVPLRRAGLREATSDVPDCIESTTLNG